MSDQLPQVWATRDLPVLLEVARRIDGGETMPHLTDVAASVGLDLAEVHLAALALQRRGLVDHIASFQATALRFRSLSGEAYLLTGLHPNGDDAVSDLVLLLRQAADQVQDPDERTRLRRLADAAGGVSREVLAGVLTTLAAGIVGGLAQ